ncbi:hypothetical protein ABCS21_010560 (plasmid) [Campylobacter coli]
MHEQVKQGVINSRPELISFLELNSIQVTRQGSDYISVKLPESQRAKRFKGSIYNERFRSTEELERIRREKETRARAYQQRDIKAERERVKRELDKLIQSKNEFYREAINRANERLRKRISEALNKIEQTNYNNEPMKFKLSSLATSFLVGMLTMMIFSMIVWWKWIEPYQINKGLTITDKVGNVYLWIPKEEMREQENHYFYLIN